MFKNVKPQMSFKNFNQTFITNFFIYRQLFHKQRQREEQTMAPLKSQSQFIPNVRQFYISRWCSFSFPPSKCCSPTEDKTLSHLFCPEYTEFLCITYNLGMGFAAPNFPLKSKQQDAMCFITSQSLLIKSSFCPIKQSFLLLLYSPCYILPR